MLKDKAVVVTGSTSGIGLGVAAAFAREGCKVMLNGLGDAGEIEAVCADLAKAHGTPVRFHGANMMKPDEIAGLIAATEKEFGSCDVLVNNAGVQYTALIEDFPADKWDTIIAINLSSAFHTMKAALPGMYRRGWGRVINIASAHGLVASKQKAAYVAAKHGVNGLTKVGALESAETPVTVNAICPGWVLTPLVQKQIDTRAEKEGKTVKEAELELLSEKQPSKTFATSEQIGGLAVFLCSPSADQITGQCLGVDGGWTAQ